MSENAARIECRSCGFALARLAADRRYVEVTAGVYLTVHLAEQKTRLVCPRCLTGRWMSDITFTAMAVPKHPAVA